MPDPILGPHIDIRPNLERAPLTHLDPETVLHGMVETVGLLPNGTVEGRASVAIVICLDDGRRVVAETTFRLAASTARCLAACDLGRQELSRP